MDESFDVPKHIFKWVAPKTPYGTKTRATVSQMIACKVNIHCHLFPSIHSFKSASKLSQQSLKVNNYYQ